VEDSFLLQGGALNDAKRALQLEGELLDELQLQG
jgi:[protein-PII] uridylyltransferase